MILIAGPYALEFKEHAISIARRLRDLAKLYEFDFYFKTSFDKANRTSGESPRGAGLAELKETFDILRSEGIKTLTDIHEPWHAKALQEHVDVLQIPAMLCRQTSLIQAAAETGCIVNIKKGQFMDPHAMKYAKDKTKWATRAPVWLTERGTTFGYNNLVVDFRSLIIMKEENPDAKIIFDCTHSVQRPSAGGDKSGADRQFALPLAKAAVAVGVDGIFLETHPEPDKAPSDGPNMIPLEELPDFLEAIKTKE